MKKEKLIVIGAVAAGTKAASKAKRDNPSMEVMIFTKDRYISYAGCGLPYYIGGVIKEKEDLLVRTPEAFKEQQDIDIYTEHEVKNVNSDTKTVTVENL
jgi:NADPH-dependent 2,4-dienoyl-CoA reductase/sulfur reductase-like enzyme